MPLIGTDKIWRVTDVQDYLSQEVRNVYHYRAQDQVVVVTPAQVWQQWEAVVGNTLALAQSSDLDHISVEVEVLGDPILFGTFGSLVGLGAKSGDPTPPFLAWSATLRRTTRETRDGRKRFAGVIEQDTFEDTIAPGSVGPYANTVNTLDQALPVAGTNLVPVIVGPRRDPVTKELLPVSQWFYNLVSGATSTFRLTTQNTRKRGVGN